VTAQLARPAPAARAPLFEVTAAAVLRTPAFPAAILRRVYEAPDLKLALFELFERDPKLLAAIRLASPSLAVGIKRWLLRTPEDDQGAAHSSLAYLARCTTRCTPLAACAAVSALRVERAAPVTELRCEREVERRTRPDSGWVYGVVHRLEHAIAQYDGVRVAPSGLAYRKNGRLEVADAARTHLQLIGRAVAAVAVPTALNDTLAVRTVVEAAHGGVPFGEVVARAAAALGSDAPSVAQLVAKLVDVGVLVSELRVPLTGDPPSALHDVLERTSLELADALAAFREALREADRAELAQAPDALERAIPLALALGSSEHYWQIDARRTATGAVGADVVDRIETALSALYRITPETSSARRLAAMFLGRYNPGREVPLLELLDPADGMRFEEIFKRDPDESAAARHGHLLELASGAIAEREHVLRLDDAALDALARGTRPVVAPKGYEAICHLVRGAGGAVVPVLSNGAREGTSRSQARFYDLLPDDEEPAARSAEPPDTIVAEFVALPHSRRAANVAIRRRKRDYEIVCGVRGTVPPERTITLDDIVVGESGGRLYLRSVRLGKRLRVEQEHLLNPSTSSRFAAFFSLVEWSPKPLLAFDWGPLAAQLPFRPRVEIAGVVVALASWRVPRTIALDFGGERAAAWRRTWNVPRFAYLTFGDNRLLLDLTRPTCTIHIQKAASKLPAHAAVTLEEALPFFGDEIVHDQDGSGYFGELAVSLVTRGAPESAQPAAPAAVHELVPRAVTHRPPGSDWTYLKLYIAAERCGYFVEREIRAFRAELAPFADEAFFIRYADPDFHVRFRAHARTAADRDRLALACLNRAHRWVESGVLARVAFDTYDREVERYGGVACIALAERVFTCDSDRVLERIAALRTASDRELFLIEDAAEFVLAAFGTPAAAHRWLRAVVGRRGHVKAETWKRVRAARQSLARRGPQPGALGDAVAELLRTTPEWRRDEIARALFHMHANRLGLAPAEEERLLDWTVALFDGLVASAPAGSRPNA
jgi:lantibiotic biosynthesis protein